MRASNFDLGFFENDVIRRGQESINAFVDEVNSGYYGSETQVHRNDEEFKFIPRISQNSVTGSLGPDGSYEPLHNIQSLSKKLSTNNPVNQYSQRSLISDSLALSQTIYGKLNIDTNAGRSFIGDLASINQNYHITNLNNLSTQSPLISTGQSLGNRSLGGADQTGMQKLKDSLDSLQNRLSKSFISSKVTPRYAEGDPLNAIAYDVSVPTLRSLDNLNLNLEAGQSILSSNQNAFSYRTFTFTATSQGVIDSPSNTYISKGLIKTPGGFREVNSFENAGLFVESYVRSQDLILDQGAKLAFEQFISTQQRLGANQTYAEIDRFLGREIGYSTFTEAVRQISSTQDVHAFMHMQTTLQRSLLESANSDGRIYSQVGKDRLTEIRQSQIQAILKPISNSSLTTQSISTQVIKNFANTLLKPFEETLADNIEAELDAFTALKLKVLKQSTLGAAILSSKFRELDSGLLKEGRSPFLQPHSANYSGGQLAARTAYYSSNQALLTRPGSENYLVTQPGAYQHGIDFLPVGKYNIPISAQSVNGNIVSFYNLEALFTSSAQLEITTLDQIKQDLTKQGYVGQAQDNFLTRLSNKLKLSKSEEEQEQILLVPYKKPEQIPQRLKNLTGTAYASEYNYSFYQDVLNQRNLDKYKDFASSTSISTAKSLAGQINTVLPKQQYQYLVNFAAANNLDLNNPQDAAKFTAFARAAEANPFSELRGLASAANNKRLLIQTGLSQSSDYMHVNAAYDAVYGYEQKTKIELESVLQYTKDGNKFFTQNLGLDQERVLLQQAFQAGRTIFYSNQELKHTNTQRLLELQYQDILTSKFADSINYEQQANLDVLNRAAILQLKQQNPFIESARLVNNQITFTLKAGLYGTEDGLVKNFGLFDGDTSRLNIGLSTKADKYGNVSQVQALNVKISGRLRKDQGGVAVVNNLIEFEQKGGRLVGTADYTILFDGQVRPGVENVKGPARIDSSEIFDYFDKQFQGNQFYSNRTLDKPIYATASAASLKGFNYESGLDILSTTESYNLLKNQLYHNTTQSVALLAAYFTDSTYSSSANISSERSTLDNFAASLKSNVVSLLRRPYNTKAIQDIGHALETNRFTGGLGKSSNLFINNAGLFGLISDSARNQNYSPNAQLQISLLEALSSQDQSRAFLDKITELFESSRSSANSLDLGGYKSFNQSSSVNRASSVLANIFALTYQAIGYSEAQNINPLYGAVLELGLINKQGQINKEVLLGKSSDQVLDLLLRSKEQLPSPKAVKRLQESFRSNSSTDFSKNRDYEMLAAAVANVYAASQTSIPLQLAVRILPSKKLVAAGSKDTSNLEFHYSAAMSKRQIDNLRGYVSDIDSISEITHAYYVLSNFSQNKGYRGLDFLSSFGSARTKLYKQITQFMDAYNTPGQRSSNLIGGAMYNFAQKVAVGMDTTSLVSSLDQIKTVANQYLGSLENKNLPERALALATLSDSRRLTHRQMAVLGEAGQSFNISNKNLVFFDIETTDLVDISKAVRDRSRYPKQISELAFIYTDQFGKTKSNAYRKDKFISVGLDNLANLLRYNPDTVLVGHNIRSFDVPTLHQALSERGVNVDNLQLIDTYADADITKAYKEFGLTKFNLGTVYKTSELVRLQNQLKDPNINQTEKQQILSRIQSGEYGQFNAHQALADVKANIQVYDFIKANNLFKESSTKISAVDLTGQLFEESNKGIYFFNAAADPNKDSFFTSVLDLTTRVIDKSKRLDLAYEVRNKGYEYLDDLDTKYNKGLILDYAVRLVDLATNDIGRLSTKGVDIKSFLYQTAIKEDTRLFKNIDKGFQDSENTYVDTLESLAKTFLNVSTELSLDSRNKKQAKVAYDAFSNIYKSKVVALPLLNIEYTDDLNRQRVSFVSAPSTEKNRAILGSSMLLFGVDVLRQLPKEFETYVPEIIRHRREIDQVLPDYFDLIERIQKQTADRQEVFITAQERHLLEKVEILALDNKRVLANNLAGTFAQRAFGEKTKNQGISSTAVASYLLQIDEIAVGARFKQLGREGYVFRAGGPSFASQLSQDYKFGSLDNIVKESENQNSLVKLDLDKNRTTVLMPIFGRFGSQGGDFDGDSYAIIGNYQKELEKLRDLKNSLKSQDRNIESLEKELAHLDRKSLPGETQDKLSKLVYSEKSTLGEYAYAYDRTIKVLQESNAGKMRVGFISAVSESISAQALDYTGQDFSAKTFSESANELRAAGISDQVIGNFYTQGVKVGFNYLKDSTYLARQYEEHLQNQLSELRVQAQVTASKITKKEAIALKLQSNVEQIGIRAVASMRRHVASYTGIPAAFLAEESGLFHSAEVFQMIEQQAGILPELQNYQTNKSEEKSRIYQVTNVLANIQTDFNKRFFNAERIGEVSDPIFHHALNKQTTQDNQEGSDIVRRFATDYGVRDFLSLDPTERLNLVIKDLNQDALGDAMSVITKLTANAGGSAISSTSFSALQSVIGATGTSLIGEAYNSITTLAAKTMMARGISEAFSGAVQQNALGISTGIEQTDTQPTMFELIQNRFNTLMPEGNTWGTEANDEQKAQMTEARNILAEIFKSPEALVKKSFDRAQTFTGLLANVQQMVRDSLKEKEGRGLLESIQTEKLGGTDQTILDILSSDQTSREDRFAAMRVFLSQQAGDKIFNIAGESTFEHRYKITAYGSLFLLSDFMRTSEDRFEYMIHPPQGNESDSTKIRDLANQRYSFLTERYKRIQNLAQDLSVPEYQRNKYNAMLQDSKTFIAQSTVDLLNISIAQRQVYQAAFRGRSDQDQQIQLNQMQRIRNAALAAFGNTETFDGDADTNNFLKDFGFDFSGRFGNEYAESVKAALYIGDGGEDLLAQDNNKIEYAQTLGLDVNNLQDYSKNEFEFFRRVTTQFLYTQAEYTGLNVQDVLDMRTNMQTTSYLRYESLEGSTTFRNFLNVSAAATDAFTTQLMRDQVTDPTQMSAIAYEAGGQLFSAMEDLHQDLQNLYGADTVNLMSQHINQNGYINEVPRETLDAYKAAHNSLGIFNSMLDKSVSPEVAEHVSNMFAISMASKNTDGVSGYGQMGQMLAGMAQMQRNQIAVLENAADNNFDAQDPEMLHNLAKYQEALNADNPINVEPAETLTRESSNKSQTQNQTQGTKQKIGRNTTNFLMELGRESLGAQQINTPALDNYAEQIKTEQKISRRSGILSAFAAPVVLTLLGSKVEADENLLNRGIDLSQAVAQIHEMNNPSKSLSSGHMYQIDRLKGSLKSDGLFFGAIKGAASELMFESVSRFAHQAIGAKGKGYGAAIAEGLSTLVALTLAQATSDRKYGALESNEDTYQAQSLYALPELAIGISEQALEEFLSRNSMEAEDAEEEIYYDASLNTMESRTQQDLDSNYARLDINDEFGNQVDTTFDMNDFSQNYNPLKAA